MICDKSYFMRSVSAPTLLRRMRPFTFENYHVTLERAGKVLGIIQ